MEGICGFLVGLIAGILIICWTLAGVMCIPKADPETGLIIAQWQGKNYELVRLLGDREVVKDD